MLLLRLQGLYRLQNLVVELQTLSSELFRSTGPRLEREVDWFLSQQVSTSPKKKTNLLGPPAFQRPLKKIYESCRASFESDILHAN